jgi:hypothetical protein
MKSIIDGTDIIGSKIGRGSENLRPFTRHRLDFNKKKFAM